MMEKEIENSILSFLDFIGVFAWKNQSVGIYDPIKKIYRRSNNKYHRKGIADILGIVEGKFLAIEVKSKTGTISPEQRIFIARVNQDGGIGFIARSVSQCALELSKHTKDPRIEHYLKKMNWSETKEQ